MSQEGSHGYDKGLKDQLLQESMPNFDENMEIEEEEDFIGKDRTYLFYSPKFENHCSGRGEKSNRCSVVYSELQRSNILYQKELKQPKFDRISYTNLLTVHDALYIQSLITYKHYCKIELDYNTLANNTTYKIAELAAGSVIEAVNYLQNSKLNFISAFCLIRPPGHHAFCNSAEGYCFYNNAAIGATYALQKFEVERVCILDWDVHHGDGTQNKFYQSKNVLYISIHRHEKKKFFPKKETGGCKFIGEGDGKYYNVNVAWNTTGKSSGPNNISHKHYKFVFEKYILGIIEEFNPKLIIVSAGFDSAKGDPFGQQQVDIKFFPWATEQLKKICPRVLMVLEGGYKKDVLSDCCLECIKTLLGQKSDYLPQNVSKS